MNIVALISAALGVVLLWFAVIFGNRVKNKWLGYLIAIVGIVVALGLIGSFPTLLGDSSLATSTKAGEYFGMLIIGSVIIKYVFFRSSKNESKES